jgi:Fe2+ transport system protein B
VLCDFSKGQALMLSVSRDVVALIRIFTSCLTAAFLIFFISSLSGEDLIKNNSFIEELDRNLLEITAELEGGIENRIKQLGEVPAINPYKKFYCAEFAKEIHEISYLTEKQKILFDSFNVRDFESKSKRLVAYSENADIQALMNELEIVKRELKNSVNLIDKRRKKLVRQRTAYIILFFVLWIVIYFYYSRGFIRR